MQARFYAPWYGRFLSPDPARDQHFEETQSWNIYSYVRNNPVTHIDPNGMEDYPIADMPQMRVLSLTQSGIPAARAERMVAQEQQQRAVMGGTATAALATGGLASTPAGVGMLARVGAGLTAAKDTFKEMASKAGNALGNLFSRGGQAAPAAQQEAQAVNPDKLQHVFGNASHGLDGLVQSFGGSQSKAFNAIQDAANLALKDGKLSVGANGVLPGGQSGAVLNVNGVNVQMVGGRVIDGVVQIGSVSRRYLEK